MSSDSSRVCPYSAVRDTDYVVRTRRERHSDVAIDRHRQHEAVVVVGVLADEVDAAGRDRERRVDAAPELLELPARTKKEGLTDHGNDEW